LEIGDTADWEVCATTQNCPAFSIAPFAHLFA
jgi:hypothetical protein